MAFPWLPVLTVFIGESREFGVGILALQAARRLHHGANIFCQAQQGKNTIA
jgi:hypothetical protein